MALTIVKIHSADSDHADFSSMRAQPIAIQLDASYPTGGYAVSATQFGFNKKVFALALGSAVLASRVGQYQLAFDHFSQRLRVFTLSSNSWTEVANGTNCATVNLKGMAIGY